jgi:DNA repair exonuclease SbcCD ATPase subunit
MRTLQLDEFRKQVDKRLVEFNMVRAKYRGEHQAHEEVKNQIENINEAQSFAQQVAQQVQQVAHNQIAGVVTKCLQAVFDEPYIFCIHFEKKRGRTEARLVFERDGMEVDPMTASGGGVIDVAAFALRLSCLLLAKPPLRRVLILDEPFKYVSEDLRGRVRLLLETLAQEMDTQFIIVTHINQLKTGLIVQL